MFLLLFYCGLLSTIVSAHFNNDTSHDGDELDINTTLSTLPSTTIPVSKDCVLEMKENEVSEVIELFNSNLVNVVVIHISFSNGSHEGELFSDFNVLLSSPIGREILYALERSQFRYFPWTLKAGIRNFKLNVNGSQNDCIERRKNASDFVLESTQHIVDSVNLAINYHVCSSFKETSSGKVKQTCCHMTKSSLSSKFNYKCPKGNSFLLGSNVPWIVTCILMSSFAFFCLAWVLSVFQSRTEFNLKYPEYYKLEESMMSPSSILVKVIWDPNGQVVSFSRRLVLVVVFSYFWYFAWSINKERSVVFIIFTPVFVFWGLSFLVSNLFRPNITNSSLILNRMKEPRNLDVLSENGPFEFLVKFIGLLFDPSVWRLVSITVYYGCKDSAGHVTGQFRNRILKTLALCFYYVLVLLICFMYVSITFCWIICALPFSPFFLCVNFLFVMYDLEYHDDNVRKKILCFFIIVGFCLLSLIFALIIANSIVSFLLGLFLNLVYFIPYIAFFSVLTFYCSTYWKTMEEEYFVLKQLIYETCREAQNINNGCIPNRHPKPSEKVLPVVSRELYDKIRKKLLPYDTNLFYFVLKMLWAIAFSLGILALINMLNELNVTGLVQVVTTASLGVMPHIFNMVALKTSEAKTKAKNENLKLNIKYIVNELICEHLVRTKIPSRTVPVRQQDDDVMTEHSTSVDESIKDSEHFEHIARTVLIIEPKYQGPENAARDWLDKLSKELIPNCILATSDDEISEDSKDFDIMFGIDCSDNHEIGPVRTTDESDQNSENAQDSEDKPLIQQNDEATVEDNYRTHENSNDNVEGEDSQLNVIVHRNPKALAEDDDIEYSEGQPLIQQNDEATVEDNYRTHENSNDNVEGEDSQLNVIVHQNPKALAEDEDIEYSEDQPLIQQNNDVVVEGNDKNYENTHDNVEGDVIQLNVIVHRNPESSAEDDDVEDSEDQPVIQQNAEVTAEKSEQNFENLHGKVEGQDCPLNVTVHRNPEYSAEYDDIEDSEDQPVIQQNDEVTGEKQDQSFEIANDDVGDKDCKLTVIVHRNPEALAEDDDIEDSEDQPLIQQNDEVTVEEKDQNFKNAHDNVEGEDSQLTVIVHRNPEDLAEDKGSADSEEKPSIQQNNDLTVENDQSFEIANDDDVDDKDCKLTVIIDRNPEALIEDEDSADSEVQPSIQQNNDLTVENDQSFEIANDDDVDDKDCKLTVIIDRNPEALIEDEDSADSEVQPSIQQNNDLTVENDQSFEIANDDDVDDKDCKLTVIIDRNPEALAEDEDSADSEEKPSIQQNNDLTVENDQSFEIANDDVDDKDCKLTIIIHRSPEALSEDDDTEEEKQQNNDATVEGNDQKSVFKHCTLS